MSGKFNVKFGDQIEDIMYRVSGKERVTLIWILFRSYFQRDRIVSSRTVSFVSLLRFLAILDSWSPSFLEILCRALCRTASCPFQSSLITQYPCRERTDSCPHPRRAKPLWKGRQPMGNSPICCKGGVQMILAHGGRHLSSLKAEAFTK
jgi:hypothetical protein